VVEQAELAREVVRQVSELAEEQWEPDPALDVWDPAWDADREPPQPWERELSGEPPGLWDEPAGPGACDPGAGPAPGWTGEGEAWAAGFLHRDRYEDVPAGQGFASGGFADILEAGPMLAILTDRTSRDAEGGHAGLGESELIGVMCAWRRLASWAAAGQAAAVMALSQRRAVQAREHGNPHLSEHVGDEIAAALTLTFRAASGLHGDALALARLPEVHAGLADGRIDWPKAAVFATELSGVPGDAAIAIAARVLPAAPDLTTSQIRARLRRLVLAFDPDGAQRRKAGAAGDSDVMLWTEPSGNAALAGRELPEASALAADRRLTALARWLAGRGAAGSLGQLRSAAFLALLQGTALESLLPPGMPARERRADRGSPGNAGSPGGTGSPGDPAAWQPHVSGTIHLTMPLTAWADLTDQAGEVAGYGPLDAATCRELAAMMTAGPGARWQVSAVTPAGQAIATAAAKAGDAPPPGPAAIRWARGLAGRLEWLRAGDCDHARAEDGYEPSRFLRNLIIFRQPACSFPGCRRPAAHCDLDHTRPYDQGGLTCECNLAPLCRKHHRAKQAPCWLLTQDQPAVMRWRLPSGRTYTTRPEPYPV